MSDEPEMVELANLPWCTCSRCGHRCQCIAMPDGTVYKPLAWEFESPEALEGICGGCIALNEMGFSRLFAPKT